MAKQDTKGEAKWITDQFYHFPYSSQKLPKSFIVMFFNVDFLGSCIISQAMALCSLKPRLDIHIWLNTVLRPRFRSSTMHFSIPQPKQRAYWCSVESVPRAPSPFPFSHGFCARHILSKQGRLQPQGTPIWQFPHVIDNSARATPHLSWTNAAPGGCPLRPCLNPPLVACISWDINCWITTISTYA